MNRKDAAEAVRCYDQIESRRVRIAMLRRTDWKQIGASIVINGESRDPRVSRYFEIMKVSDHSIENVPQRELILRFIAAEADRIEAEIPPLQRRLAQLGFKPEDAK